MTGGGQPQIESASADLDICIFFFFLLLYYVFYNKKLEVELVISKRLSCLNASFIKQ